jgi:hypothetical protein
MAPVQRNSSYQCPRCGYSTPQLSHYKNHLKRQRLCPPSLGEVVPTVENAIRAQGGSINNQEIHLVASGERSTVRTNIDNHIDNSVVDNSVTTTNNTFILAFGKEDTSHLTPALMDLLVRKAAASSDDGDRAVLNLIQLMHFNPAKPQNMNLFVAPGDTSSARVFCGGIGGGDSGGRWVDRNQVATIFNLACDRACDLATHATDNVDRIGQTDADRVDSYYDGVDRDGSPLFGKAAELVKDQSFQVPYHHPTS